MKIPGSLAVLVCAAVLASCDKNAVQDIAGPAPTSAVKFFNFGVNAPGVNFYANTQKLTAISSTTGTESVNGTTYGNAGDGGFYSGIAPGAYTLTGKIAAATDKDLAISTSSSTLAEGKYYSYYQSGFYNATAKTVESFLVEDDFAKPIDYAQTYVRFVNAISNSSPMVLYAKHTVTGTETAIGGAIAYKSAGSFVALPGGSYDLNTRLAGSTTNIITRAGVSFSSGHVYTIGARGDITLPSSGTAVNRAQLDNTANR